MFPVKEFERRFQEILECLDALKNQAAEDAAGAMEELNANFEDALFVIETIEDDEDWREAFEDALAEFEDLREAYRKQADALPGLEAVTERLDLAIRLARSNL